MLHSITKVTKTCFEPSETGERFGRDGDDISVPQVGDSSVLLNRFTSWPDDKSDIVCALLEAFPEKRRIMFVHIPKCAGSDIRENLRKLYPLVEPNLADSTWTGARDPLASLEPVLSRISESDTLVAHGHLTLRWYLERQLKRPGDHLFAIVREPVDLLISWVNYVLTILVTDRESRRPDTRDWRAKLGIGDLPVDFVERELVAMADRIILETDIIGRDSLCAFLGDGDCASAERMIAESGIELADISDYAEWLGSAFGIHANTRENESYKVVRRRSLSSRQFTRILELTQEDRALYPKLRTRPEHSGRSRGPGSSAARGVEPKRRLRRWPWH